VYGGVTNGIANMQLDADKVAFDPVAQMELLKDQVKFGRERFFGIEVSLPRRAEIYFGCHHAPSLTDKYCLNYISLRQHK
jgi:hypothetical protein